MGEKSQDGERARVEPGHDVTLLLARWRAGDDGALDELGKVDEELAKIVELRFFGGLEHDEIAAVLGASNATVRRRFRIAKASLYRRLGGQERADGG